MHRPLFVVLVSVALTACNGADADAIGVGAECGAAGDCAETVDAAGDIVELECLTEFAGGYCGIAACTHTVDCPVDAICVAHDDGTNYCFRSCLDKAECNANRSPDDESNCSSNFVWADPADDDGGKACIPPSSG